MTAAPKLSPLAPCGVTWWANLANPRGRFEELPGWGELFDALTPTGPHLGDAHPGWSAARFEGNRRALAHVREVYALTFDYDDGLPIADVLDRWRGVLGYLHTTRRHTAEKPRCRVILPLARPVNVDEYRRLWSALQGRAGAVDGATKDPARFWFKPSEPAGGFERHVLTGAPLDPDEAIAAAPRPQGAPFPRASDVERRAIAYLATMPAALAGRGGHNATWRAALALARGFALDEYTTLRLLLSEYNPRCEPPWSERELAHKAKQAVNATTPLGYVLEGDRDREREALRAQWGRDDEPEPPPDDGAPWPDEEHPAPAAPAGQAGQGGPLPWLATLEPIGEAVFIDEPPPKAWLLTRTDPETGEVSGVLERSIVASTVAPGGRGKSWALTQLAIAVAIGGRWLDAFQVEAPGNVLLALAEESDAEVRRRLHAVGRALGLTAEERHLAGERIVALGLRGTNVSLVSMDKAGHVFPSETHVALAAKLAEREWSLLIFDPLSRWAPGVEGSNEAATMTVELLEVLSTAPGAPTVMVAHHTGKASRRDGNRSGGAASRGVTGLTDAWRWEAQITGKAEDDLALSCEKVNGARPFETVQLVRDNSGVLRRATIVEAGERSARAAAKQAALDDEVVAAVAANPDASTSFLRRTIRGAGNPAIDAAILRCLHAERIVDAGTSARRAYRIADPAQPAPTLPEAAGQGDHPLPCPPCPALKGQAGQGQANADDDERPADWPPAGQGYDDERPDHPRSCACGPCRDRARARARWRAEDDHADFVDP